jgi:hypothetical protein
VQRPPSCEESMYKVIQFTADVAPLELTPRHALTVSGLFMVVTQEDDSTYTGIFFYSIDAHDYAVHITVSKTHAHLIGATSYLPELTTAKLTPLN